MSDAERTQDLSAKACPVCKATSLEQPFDEVVASCENCGVVIQEWGQDFDIQIPDERESETDLTWDDIRPAHNSTEHRIAEAISQIEQIATKLDINSETRIQAAKLYGQAFIENLTDGRSIDAVATAALYITTKLECEPRPLRRLSSASSSDYSTVHQTVRCFRQELDSDLTDRGNQSQPEDYLHFLGAELELSRTDLKLAEEILKTICERTSLTGKNPAGVAAAVLYLGALEPPSQREVSHAAGVSAETVRVRLNEFRPLLEGDR